MGEPLILVLMASGSISDEMNAQPHPARGEGKNSHNSLQLQGAGLKKQLCSIASENTYSSHSSSQ
jgi:hypothetical protein